jgi:hypothetical protein
LTGVLPSLLLHPLDFLSGEDAPELEFFPGMNVPAIEKIAFVSRALAIYTAHFDVVPMREHANAVRDLLTASQPQPQEVL